MSEQRFLPRQRLDELITALRQAGYACVGPRLAEHAIVYQPIESAADLPAGVRTREAPGRYRVEQSGDARLFAWASGPQALKPLTFAPRELLWRVARAEGGLSFESVVPAPAPTAVIGVRPCDLAALAIHDRHFGNPELPEAHYLARRASLFLVVVNCSHPADTCFCASTGDGPAAAAGFDLALDELEEGFLVRAGSERGEGILAGLPLAPASGAQQEEAAVQIKQAAAAQSRSLPGRNLAAALLANLDHPRWEEVAKRCLSCGNCTQVCPTCFCHAHFENPALSGGHSDHYREWDSCFSENHSYIHGVVIRPDTQKRYRQWLTHKLGSWHAQFGRAGCVGCGRCIVWCPAGIDLTEEAAAICTGAQS